MPDYLLLRCFGTIALGGVLACLFSLLLESKSRDVSRTLGGLGTILVITGVNGAVFCLIWGWL